MNERIAEMLDAVIASNQWSETEAATAIGTSQPTINRIRNLQVGRIDYMIGTRISDLHSKLPKRERVV